MAATSSSALWPSEFCAAGRNPAVAAATRAGGGRPASRETRPLVNVAASLMVAALLTLLAYAVSRPLVALAPTPRPAHPDRVAIVLIGFFVLVTKTPGARPNWSGSC